MPANIDARSSAHVRIFFFWDPVPSPYPRFGIPVLPPPWWRGSKLSQVFVSTVNGKITERRERESDTTRECELSLKAAESASR